MKSQGKFQTPVLKSRNGITPGLDYQAIITYFMEVEEPA